VRGGGTDPPRIRVIGLYSIYCVHSSTSHVNIYIYNMDHYIHM